MSTTVPWSHLGLEGYDCEEIVVDGWLYFDEGDGGGALFTVKEDWYDSIEPGSGSMLSYQSGMSASLHAAVGGVVSSP